MLLHLASIINRASSLNYYMKLVENSKQILLVIINLKPNQEYLKKYLATYLMRDDVFGDKLQHPNK